MICCLRACRIRSRSKRAKPREPHGKASARAFTGPRLRTGAEKSSNAASRQLEDSPESSNHESSDNEVMVSATPPEAFRQGPARQGVPGRRLRLGPDLAPRVSPPWISESTLASVRPRQG
jgi:hypothetical protein